MATSSLKPKPPENTAKSQGVDSNNWRKTQYPEHRMYVDLPKRAVKPTVPQIVDEPVTAEEDKDTTEEELDLPFRKVKPLESIPGHLPLEAPFIEPQAVPKVREAIPRPPVASKVAINKAPLQDDRVVDTLFDRIMSTAVSVNGKELCGASPALLDKFKVAATKKRMPVKYASKPHGSVMVVEMIDGTDEEMPGEVDLPQKQVRFEESLPFQDSDSDSEVEEVKKDSHVRDTLAFFRSQLSADAINVADLPQVASYIQEKPIYGLPKGSVVVPDPVQVYLATLPPGEKPKPIFVARESAGLRAISPYINGTAHEESLLDAGSQIVSMNEEAAVSLGVPWDPDIQIHMQSANNQLEKSLGLAKNIPFRIEDITVYLQVHVIKGVAYKVLLGRPFDIITESGVQNRSDGSQVITLKCPNTQKRVVIPTFERGKSPAILARNSATGPAASVFHQPSMNWLTTKERLR